MESAGFSRRCMGMSVSLRVVPSSTGLPSKRCPGVRFLSRVNREFGIFQHMAPTMRLLFEFPHETGLIRPHPEVRGERREPLADKTWESTLLSRSGGVKGLTGSGTDNVHLTLALKNKFFLPPMSLRVTGSTGQIFLLAG